MIQNSASITLFLFQFIIATIAARSEMDKDFLIENYYDDVLEQQMVAEEENTFTTII